MAKIVLAIYITGMVVWSASSVGTVSPASTYKPELPFTMFIVLFFAAALGYFSALEE